MIPILKYGVDSLDRVFSRSQINDQNLINTVKEITEDVRLNGDEAVFKYTKKFDNLDLNKDTVLVSQEEIDDAYSKVSEELLNSLRKSKENVFNYHKRQVVESQTDDKVGWIMKPINRAGIYVPGGTAAYPSSVIMCAMPAKAAGVKEVVMVTPKPENPLTIVAAVECGIKKIYKVGGAQAIAGLAYGTDSIPKVDTIVGPGNIFVTLAKKEVFGHTSIDMIAGPSEILVIADETANSEYLVADLLSQAEHDKMAASILITTSKELAEKVQANIEVVGKSLPRAEIINTSLTNNCAIILVDNLEDAVKISDKIAPEHLELCVENPKDLAFKISNAGAIFAGHYSPEPLGDYFAGPSHVLPTSGTAKYFSVLNTQTFMKRISLINYTKEDLSKVSDDIIRLAECEGLDAHALSIKVRRDK